jgi:polyribonucleotide nucleotidyltransferase
LGKDVKREYNHEVNDEALRERMNKELYQPAYDITKQALPKQDRADAFEKLLTDFKEKFFEERKAAAENSEGSEDSENAEISAWDAYFHGAIDELAVYNVALSQGQVTKLYNDQK